MSERLSWNQYFLMITRQVAERSTCLRAKVGAVIVRDRSIVATGYNVRLSEFMLDATRTDLSVFPNRKFFREHACLSSYTEAGRFAAEGLNIYELERYVIIPKPGEYKDRYIGPISVDIYQYPPTFLILPYPAVAAGIDFFTVRRVWFFIQSLLLLTAIAMLASWIGGPAGIAALLCTGLTGLAAAWPFVAGVWAWLGLAVCNTVFVPIHSRVGMSFPGHLAGRALTAYNLVIFVSAFAVQSILGVVVDGLLGGGWAEADAFRASLAALAIAQLTAWLAFVRWPVLGRLSGVPKRPAPGE